MKTCGSVWTVVACLLLAGCGEPAANKPGGGAATVSKPEASEPQESAGSGETSHGAEVPVAADAIDKSLLPDSKLAPIAGGVAKLTPENTSIKFVGTHVAADPKPRAGGFKNLSGKADVDAAAKALKSISIDIDVESLWTHFGKLTGHLKSPDFFDVNEHKSAKFESTGIAAGDKPGEYTITGKLTLHGVTKEISFPALVQIGDDGLNLATQFTFDRTEFGMDYKPDQVDKIVSLTAVIGPPTVVEPEQSTP